MMQNPEKWLKTRHMGTHVRILSESYSMYTNMTWLKWFSEKLDESSLNIGRVKTWTWILWVNHLFGDLDVNFDIRLCCSHSRVLSLWLRGTRFSVPLLLFLFMCLLYPTSPFHAWSALERPADFCHIFLAKSYSDKKIK